MELGNLILKLLENVHDKQNVFLKYGTSSENYQKFTLDTPTFSLYFENAIFEIDCKTPEGRADWPLNIKSNHEQLAVMKEMDSVFTVGKAIQQCLQKSPCFDIRAGHEQATTLMLKIKHDTENDEIEYNIFLTGNNIYQASFDKDKPFKLSPTILRRAALLNSLTGDTGKNEWFVRNRIEKSGCTSEVFADTKENAIRFHYLISDSQNLTNFGEEPVKVFQQVQGYHDTIDL